MSTKFRFLILFFILLLLPLHDSLAQRRDQDKASDAAALFDSAAAKHKRELDDLIRTRGGSRRTDLPDVSARNVAGVLAARTGYGEAGYLEKTAVLSYSYDRGMLHVWLVDQHGVQAYDRRKLTQRQIEKAMLNLRNSLGVDSLQLSRTPRLRRARLVYNNNAPRLPVNRAIANLTNILIPTSIADALVSVRHLIVVPILGLGTVPYPVLKPFGPDSFLIDKMSISVAPSLFDLGQTIDRWSPHFSSPLIIGNPYLPPSAKWVVPPLPGAEIEAQEVAKAFGAKPLIGKDATKQAVLMNARKSDFLYFATHGIASSDDPLSGGFLMLSASEFEKGWLTAKEIQGEDFGETQMAVLSACQTGLGKVHDAGIIGLARAFQIAGVKRVVMSLWSVNDQATNELMQAFMRNMKTNIPSEALRLAMLEVRSKRPKPSQWASFTLFGTPR